MSQVVFEPTDRQQIFMDALLSGKYRQLLYGGAIRGGKSYVLIAAVFLLARVFAGSRWAIVRKDLPTLRKNTVPVFEAIRPDTFCGPFVQDTWTAKCTNGSEILLWPESIQHDSQLNRWRGLEVNGFALEEMNELQMASFLKSIERAGSWTARGGVQPPPLIWGTCNPADNWVKEEFYDPFEEGTLPEHRFYLPATIDDNPYIDPLYRESLNDLPEPEYRRFVLGDWTVNMDPMQLIRWEWVQWAIRGHKDDGELIPHYPGNKRMGVDVARFGDDDTVFMLLDGNGLYGVHTYSKLSTDETAQKIVMVGHDEAINAEDVKVDAVGLGAGTVDSAYSMGYEVREILSGNSPYGEKESFFVFNNRRSQMWWWVREKFRKGEIRILIPDSRDRKKLVRDLTSIRYRVRTDKTFEVEPKESASMGGGSDNTWGMKQRLGRSPDYGDAFVYAFARGAPRARKAALPPTISHASAY